MPDIISIFVNSFALLFASIGFLTTFAVLILIFYHRQQHSLRSSILLVSNNYLTTLFLSALHIDFHAHVLYADLQIPVSFHDTWCYIRGYLLHVAICLLYHSYLLEAIFRFCRVIFYRGKRLRRRKVIIILILIDWCLAFGLESLMLVFPGFHYLDQYHFCELFINDNISMLTSGVLACVFPMIAISLIYFTIVQYMKRARIRLVRDNRQLSAQRDTVVLRPIIILVGLLTSLCIPVVEFWARYLFTGEVISLAYRIGWFSFTLSSSMLPIVTVYLTPQLRKLVTLKIGKNHRVHPAAIRLN